jgi:hypothetical protein
MKKAIVVIVVVVVLITAWVGFNPIGRFGFCRFGLLVYSAIPFPAVDLVIHTNGIPLTFYVSRSENLCTHCLSTLSTGF